MVVVSATVVVIFGDTVVVVVVVSATVVVIFGDTVVVVVSATVVVVVVVEGGWRQQYVLQTFHRLLEGPGKDLITKKRI